MKNNITGNSVVCNVGEAKNFGMKVNAKAYSILVSGIYQFKIEAIIRELGTNAVDSHKEAKNYNSFDVQLPTYNDPTFFIRDYGTGISKQDLEEIYFNFFASTKEDNDEATGFIGIGSKSPLAYNTKAFNVESWKDGRHCIYLCFIGNNGIPDYNLILEEDSNEPNGLKVSVPVNISDVYEFKECARKVYRWFDIKPNFIGEEQPDMSDPCSYRNDIYGIYDERKAIALMSNVAYPISYHTNLSNYSTILDKPIVLFFENGEVEFNAAREGLEYTNKTINKLKEKFDAVFSSIESDLTTKVQTSKSTFEAIINFLTFKNEIGGQLGCESFLKNDFEFNGQTVHIKRQEVANKQFTYNERRYKERTEFRPSPDHIYVHNDLKTGAIGRCFELSRNYTNKTIILLDINELSIDIDASCYILASSLPKPERIYNSNRQKVTSFMLMRDTHHVTKAWEEADIETATSKYYVIRNGYKVEHEGKEYSPCDIYTRLRMCGFNNKVYAIKAKDEEQLIEEGFENAIEFTKKEMDKLYNDALAQVATIEEFEYKKRQYAPYNEFIRNVNKIKDKIPQNHELYKFIEIYEYLQDTNEIDRWKKIISFLYSNGYKISVPYVYTVDKINLPEAEKYPMFKHFYGDNEHLYYYMIGVDHEVSCQTV